MIQQIFIFIFGVSGIWLVGGTDKWKRYGYIAGLVGQPFWFYTGIVNKQWGIVLLCCFYTYSWGYGVWNHWIKPYRKNGNS